LTRTCIKGRDFRLAGTSDQIRQDVAIFLRVYESAAYEDFLALYAVTLNRHDGGVEANSDPAVTAKAHSSTQGILGLVRHPSAEAHLPLVETTSATVTAGKDTAEDTSEGPPRCAGTTEHQREVDPDSTGEDGNSSDPFYGHTGGGAETERQRDSDVANRRAPEDAYEDQVQDRPLGTSAAY